MQVRHAIPVVLAGTVPSGLVVAHERRFLKAQSPDVRAYNTRVTAGLFAGVGAAATGVAAVAARNASAATRTAVLAGGGTMVATSLGSAELAIATSPTLPGDSLPPGSDLKDGFLDTLPTYPVRVGETALVGGALGLGAGVVTRRSIGGAGAGLGLGLLAGAGAGAVAFALFDPSRPASSEPAGAR